MDHCVSSPGNYGPFSQTISNTAPSPAIDKGFLPAITHGNIALRYIKTGLQLPSDQLWSLLLLQFETYGMTCPPPMSNRSASLPSKANISTEDYVQLLSSMCHLPGKQPPPFLNLPYITIPNLRNKVTVTRKVTNVGHTH
ncbi:hypothetical protein Q3G72_028748 [Acer saccharum]|nr:hypothetical protein Q3G72_028748 [Acer saccharum]